MIGNMIQQKRKEVGLTQAQLAERLGVSAPAVNRWEKNLSFPDATLLAPLARCLKTDINTLFSFYNALSDKERALIVENVTTLLLTEGVDQMLAYIDSVVKENPSDGKLFLNLAENLSAIRMLTKASNPDIFLTYIAEYYERALALLPEEQDTISEGLVTVYAEMGEEEKAEAAWKRLPDWPYDKRMVHVDMLYRLNDFDHAIPELKRLVVQRVLDLSTSLNFLYTILLLTEEKELAELASKKFDAVQELFGIWRGFSSVCCVASASERLSVETQTEEMEKLILTDARGEKVTTCPLFDDIIFGGRANEDQMTADHIADLISVLKNKHNGSKA